MPKEKSKKPAVRQKNIFISYRVHDTAGETDRLVESLKQYVDASHIFIDIDKLEPGIPFDEAIKKQLDFCDVMLVVIGPNWAGKKMDGSIQIFDESDWVRLEIRTAISRNILVVPVLVDNAALPTPDQLPTDLQLLSKRQAYSISRSRWKYDTDKLATFLIKSAGISRKKKWWEKMTGKAAVRVVFKILTALVLLSAISSDDCRVLTTSTDPATEYQTKVVWSYFWGLVDGPKSFQVPNCRSNNAMDEVTYSRKFEHSFLNFLTLGTVSPIEVRWKCHKPCPR